MSKTVSQTYRLNTKNNVMDYQFIKDGEPSDQMTTERRDTNGNVVAASDIHIKSVYEQAQS